MEFYDALFDKFKSTLESRPLEIKEDFIIKHKNDLNEVTRLQDWLWPKLDHGTWSYDILDKDGPVRDWIDHHSKKWFPYCKKFRCAIQAGGACGMYPRLLAEKFEVVYTFEPTPISFHCLVNNNQLDHVIKIQGALGETNDFCCLKHREDNVGLNQISTRIEDGKVGALPIFTLDQFNFPNVDLIALDVESSELAALKGAKNLITRCKPVLVVENGHLDEIKSFVTSLDYQYAETSASDTIYIPKS